MSVTATSVPAPRRIIVAISGASGAVYGARLLQVLQPMAGIESHLVVSDAGWRNLEHELDMDRAAVEALADQVHDVRNVGATLASGSFQCAGMVIAPCSMRNMVAVTEMGAIVCPPLPAFYLRPTSVGDIVDYSVGRALDLLDVPHDLAPRWEGLALAP